MLCQLGHAGIYHNPLQKGISFSFIRSQVRRFFIGMDLQIKKSVESLHWSIGKEDIRRKSCSSILRQDTP